MECRFESDMLWLTQALLAGLYPKSVTVINEHLANIYPEGEIDQKATTRKFRIVRTEGSRQVARQIDHYSLEAILAVGYPATLQEYLVKGFAMDDERLKNPPVGASAVLAYFDEMLERIRDIRASERRMYLRVKDIFTMAADAKTRLKSVLSRMLSGSLRALWA